MNSLISFTVSCWKYGPRPYATIYDIFLIQVKHALLLRSLETVVCSTPGVHLHNCKVYFVKHTVKRLLSLQLTGEVSTQLL